MQLFQFLLGQPMIIAEIAKRNWNRENLWDSTELEEHLELGKRDPIYSCVEEEEHPTIKLVKEVAQRIFKRTFQ